MGLGLSGPLSPDPDRSDESTPAYTLWHVRETELFWRYLAARARNHKDYWASISEIRGYGSSLLRIHLVVMNTEDTEKELREKRLVEEWLVESVLEGMFRDGQVRLVCCSVSDSLTRF